MVDILIELVIEEGREEGREGGISLRDSQGFTHLVARWEDHLWVSP